MKKSQLPYGPTPKITLDHYGFKYPPKREEPVKPMTNADRLWACIKHGGPPPREEANPARGDAIREELRRRAQSGQSIQSAQSMQAETGQVARSAESAPSAPSAQSAPSA